MKILNYTNNTINTQKTQHYIIGNHTTVPIDPTTGLNQSKQSNKNTHTKKKHSK